MSEEIQNSHVEGKEQDRRRVSFSDLRRGDRLVVETKIDGEPQRIQAIYKIKITGKRRERTRVTGKWENCLLARVEKHSVSAGRRVVKEYTCRIPGGLNRNHCVTLGEIGVEEEDCLLLENLKDNAGEHVAGSVRTTPITRIAVIEVGKRS